MKAIFAFLFSSLTLHAASDPGKAAIDFLEKVRTGTLNLEPGGDTAVSPQTLKKKKERIAETYKRIARDLGDNAIEVAQVKVDDSFAAVVVRKANGFDPHDFQTFSIGLVKRGEAWAAAPVLASFENIDRITTEPLRKRLHLLEDWMLREQVRDLEKTRQQSSNILRQKIEERISIAELKKLSAMQALDLFYKACAERDLVMVLSLMGGAAEKLPEDWNARLQGATQAMKTDDHSWHMATSNNVLRVPLQVEDGDEDASIYMACLDPVSFRSLNRTPQLRLLDFHLIKSADGFWQMNPDSELLQPSDQRDESEGEDDEGEDMLDLFPKKFSEFHAPQPHDSAQLALDSTLKTLEGNDLASLLRLVKMNASAKDAIASCERAAQLWWTFRNPSSPSQALILSFKEDKDRAMAMVYAFSNKNYERYSSTHLYFQKHPEGWLWHPVPDDELKKPFIDWEKTESEAHQKTWPQPLLKQSTTVEKIALAAPDSATAQQTLQTWLDAIAKGDLKAIFQHTTHFNNPKSASKFLKNIADEMSNHSLQLEPMKIIGAHQGQKLSAVGMKLVLKNETRYPLYPVIQTESGPKVLCEINLITSDKRSHQFLNKDLLERFEELTSPTIADELRTLYAEHQKSTKAAP